jgi:predicted nuclease of restriction endonuclease-like RecB superfamily
MLTADLVDVRRAGGELHLRSLDARARAEALAIAADLLDAARAGVGQSREELEAVWTAIEGDARKPRVAKGLRKLVEDACVFEAESAVDPVAVRREVFTRAAKARRERFDRHAILHDAAAALGVTPEDIERSLFADLRGSHLVRSAPTSNAASLVEAYELGRAQAVLLRAVRVVCDVEAASPGPLRALFAKLKFQRLLFTAERTERGFRITIDGPFSMFEAVTRYGVRLAMLVPALRELDRWSLVADVRWGKAREPLVFRMASTDVARTEARERSEGIVDAGTRAGEPHMADEVRELYDALRGKAGAWTVEPATVVLDVPGLGVCIPDLAFRRGERGEEVVYLEVLGFWSRDAVWKRVELVTRGLGARVIFAASTRLRVSAEVLGDDRPASLYVYKGKMSARAVLEHVERLATR